MFQSFNKRNSPESSLPIHKYRNEILEKLHRSQVLIITGETGCGKSTQLPKYLYKAGYTKQKSVLCLLPRCVLATNLAMRVAEELHCSLGDFIGYRIRFESKFSICTKIMFMTTGFMLHLIMNNKRRNHIKEESENYWVNKYSVIIVDEVHERSIETDLFLGIMKEILDRNRAIKLVIMSATLNIKQFTDYYPNSQVVAITEAMSTVKVIYRPLKSENYIKEIADLVVKILNRTMEGDILIFLHTERKVEKCQSYLTSIPGIVVLKFFANMNSDETDKVFRDFSPKRKVIVSTNIAETSLTIPGVDYVIDSGAVKRISFNHETLVENWNSEYISIAEADQRKGRTGRTRLGYCYRLYEERFLESQDRTDCNIKFPFYLSSKRYQNYYEKEYFRPFPLPEIRKGNLCNMILIMKSLGIHDVMKFPFIISPDESTIKNVTQQLINLSLLTYNGNLTWLGERVSSLPLDPRLGKVAVISSNLPCRDQILVIISMLSVYHLIGSSSKVHKDFRNWNGDLFKLLDIYDDGIMNQFDKEWCKTHSINYSSMEYVNRIYDQLNKYVPRVPFKKTIQRNNRNKLIKMAFLSGFFSNIALGNGKCYFTLNNSNAITNRDSCIKSRKEIIMFQSIFSSTNGRDYHLRNCTTLDQNMLFNVNPVEWEIDQQLWFKKLDLLEKMLAQQYSQF